MSKKMATKKTEEFYGDVVVNVQKRLRLHADIPKGLKGQEWNDAILEILQAESFRDITDEETLVYMEVLDVDDDTGDSPEH